MCVSRLTPQQTSFGFLLGLQRAFVVPDFMGEAWWHGMERSCVSHLLMEGVSHRK